MWPPLCVYFATPFGWIFLAPVYFLLNSLVILLAGRLLRLPDLREVWKFSVLPTLTHSVFSGMAGGVAVFAAAELAPRLGLAWDFYTQPGHAYCSLPGVALAFALLYLLNRWRGFAECDWLEKPAVRALSLALAVCTAPYVLLLNL